MTTHAVQPLFSTPVYQNQPHSKAATRRLVVAQALDQSPVEALISELQAHAQPLQVLAIGGTETARDALQVAASQAELVQMLHAALRSAPVGTRLYLCGDEAFIWQCREIACHAGMLNEEIELFCAGSRRQLYCVHCSALQDIADQTEVACANCGVNLLVRAHFSQRLGAYMGVCLDPNNVRGEVRP